MSSQACVDFEGGFYHVYNRGVNKQRIFLDDQDRWYFINLCQKSHLNYEAEFLAFCLMGNHYHLFIHTPKANLSKMMKYINESFSKYFIKKYKSEKKSGHTFMGPYGRRIVQNELYADNLLAYIHNNPVKDKFVNHPADYHWSSYNHYDNAPSEFTFINKTLLAQNFVPIERNAQGHGIIDSSILNWDPENYTIANLVLGDINYAKNLYENHLQKSSLQKLQTLNKSTQVINSNVLRNFLKTLKISPLQYRGILIYALLEWSELQAPQLETEFGMKASSIRKIKSRVQQKINSENKDYMKIVDEIKQGCRLF